METLFTIKTPDKKTIYGKLQGSLRKPTIVIVHGLSSTIIEALYYNAARFFEKAGFSVVLFSLYDWKKNARTLKDCTLKIHGQDIDTVISYLRRRGAKKIYVIGHSYGGPSILNSQKKDFDGVIFWDSSINSIARYFLKLKFNKSINGRIMNDGFEIVMPEGMVQEAKFLDVYKLVKNIHVPVYIICAGKGILVQGGKKMYAAANSPKSLSFIPGASHNFEEEGAQEKLYQVTLKWLENLK